MKIRKINHIGIVVNDLAAAKAFFLDVGFKVEGEGDVQDEIVDRINGLDNVRSSIVFMSTAEEGAHIELIRYHSPSSEQEIQYLPPNTPGIRHLAFEVEDIDALIARLKAKGTETFSDVQAYGGYKLLYIRGPEGIILEFSEEVKK